MDQIAALLQALQQRQIPALAAPAPPPAPPPPVAATAAGQSDPLALLRAILTNSHLQQALQPAAPAASPMPRTIQLPVPSAAAPQQLRSVPIPLNAVLGAILSLTGHATGRIGEDVSDDDGEFPAYLVGDDGRFLVDPASADQRAAVIGHLFLLNDAAQRSGLYPQLGRRSRASRYRRDTSDEWARAAGFF